MKFDVNTAHTLHHILNESIFLKFQWKVGQGGRFIFNLGFMEDVRL